MGLGSFLADILVNIGDISTIYHQYRPIYRLDWSVFFFSQAAFITHFVSDISVIYRYIGDISSILGDLFRFFQNKRLSFAKILSGTPDTRNIDDISQYFRLWVQAM